MSKWLLVAALLFVPSVVRAEVPTPEERKSRAIQILARVNPNEQRQIADFIVAVKAGQALPHQVEYLQDVTGDACDALIQKMAKARLANGSPGLKWAAANLKGRQIVRAWSHANEIGSLLDKVAKGLPLEIEEAHAIEEAIGPINATSLSLAANILPDAISQLVDAMGVE